MQVWVVEYVHPLQEGVGGVILGIFAEEDSAKSFAHEWIDADVERKKIMGVNAKWIPSTWSQNRWSTDSGWEAVSIECHSVK